jgi:sterol desaturase/sphingolipid hydroxylase (fatty acid hydroxylase superfamily)
MANRLFVSNRDESVRLFKNNFLEYFSHIHPATPVIVYIPFVLFISYLGLQRTEVSNFVLLAILGIALWTLFEYIMHRFVFHYHPTTEIGKRIHFLAHGVHHDYPRDRTRLVMPLLVSVPLAILHYFVFFFAFGYNNFLPILGGYILGYVLYDTIHFATHHWKMTSPLGRFLKEYHLKHHYVNPDSAYGVSIPVWDYVFFTVPPKEKVTEPEKIQ